jgi:hypothetical protein
MLRSLDGLSLRQMRTRTLRAGLTALGVVLGVGMAFGVLLLVGTIRHTFDELIDSARGSSDLVVTTAAGGQLPQSALHDIEATPGVRHAGAMVGGVFARLDADGKPIRDRTGQMWVAGFDPKQSVYDSSRSGACNAPGPRSSSSATGPTTAASALEMSATGWPSRPPRVARGCGWSGPSRSSAGASARAPPAAGCRRGLGAERQPAASSTRSTCPLLLLRRRALRRRLPHPQQLQHDGAAPHPRARHAADARRDARQDRPRRARRGARRRRGRHGTGPRTGAPAGPRRIEAMRGMGCPWGTSPSARPRARCGDRRGPARHGRRCAVAGAPSGARGADPCGPRRPRRAAPAQPLAARDRPGALPDGRAPRDRLGDRQPRANGGDRSGADDRAVRR